jgi:glycosyltransferase involved in cell wall biosynthesis
MKKILLLDTAHPINTRNSRILRSLSGFERYVITWNRDGRPLDSREGWTEYLYMSNAPYGNHLIKLLKLFLFALFIKRNIKAIKPDYIIASHWETLLIVAFLKTKGGNLVYENLDIPTSENPIILYVLQTLEKIALRKTDCMIVASRFYKELYSWYRKRIVILENKPLRGILADRPIQFFHTTANLKISFIGTLRYFNCMQNLIKAAQGLSLDLLFFGEGPDYGRLKQLARNYNQVFFFGKYKYEDIACIYELSDIIWAVYPSKDYNVKYAISNKFFESLVFNKPAFFAEDTALGEFVSKNGIGFIVNPYNIEGIRAQLSRIKKESSILNEVKNRIKDYNSCNSSFWDDDVQLLREIFV